MPTFEFSFKDFQKLVGKKLPRSKEKLWNKLLYVKSEVEDFEKDTLKVEQADTNRPDTWCVEGLARALQGALSVKTGLKNYTAKNSNHVLKVDKSVKKVRQYIVAAVVKNLEFDNNIIRQLIQLQLKLDTTYGRNRKKSAIGVYDYDKIRFPVTYTTKSPESVSFTPLGFEKRMNLKEIITEHPKGVEYSSILAKYKKYPLLIDADNNVLSMPPIINSNDVGKVTTSTRNVFVEVTGTSLETITGALNIITTSLIDRGGVVESVKIKTGRKTIIRPLYKPGLRKVMKSSIKKRLGLELNSSEITDLLERARFGVQKQNNDYVIVQVPFYRTDVMHEFDIIEDIGIMYGYHNIKSEKIKYATSGKLLEFTVYSRMIRKIINGMGYQEILNYYRTDKDILFNKNCVEIANPISTTMNVLRNELLPTSLFFLSKNTHNDYPQRIFEVGRVFTKGKKEVIEDNHLSMLSSHAEADYTEIKQAVEWLLDNLKLNYEIKDCEHEAFIKGRCAGILFKKEVIGYFGELHPKTISAFGIENPVSALELNIEKIMIK